MKLGNDNLSEAQKQQSNISDVSKRSQIQFEINNLLYQINSRYGAMEDIYPSEEQQLEMYKKMANLREELKNNN